jgi:hypothetical protein
MVISVQMEQGQELIKYDTTWDVVGRYTGSTKETGTQEMTICYPS